MDFDPCCAVSVLSVSGGGYLASSYFVTSAYENRTAKKPPDTQTARSWVDEELTYYDQKTSNFFAEFEQNSGKTFAFHSLTLFMLLHFSVFFSFY